jgi:ankyrin repeat protein
MKRAIYLPLLAVLAGLITGCPSMDPDDQANAPETVHDTLATTAPAPKQPTLSLHQAAASGNLQQVRSNLYYGIDVDERDANSETPLHHAARANQKNAVVLLAARGADVNARNNAGETPLALTQHRQIETYLKRMGGTK